MAENKFDALNSFCSTQPEKLLWIRLAKKIEFGELPDE
jgi:hypothetical protein